MTTAETGDAGAKRRLPIDLDQLSQAIHWNQGEADWYLDLETGDVVMATWDAHSMWEKATESFGDEGGDLAAALERLDVPEWERELVLEIDRIEHDSSGRFLAVEAVESWQGYHDMEEFIETLDDAGLQEQLGDAIRGRGAFRRFKDVLGRDKRRLDAWYAFSNARERARVLEWLESEDIEAVPRPAGAG